MRGQWKGFVSGLAVATLVFGLGAPAFAATVRQLNASYSGIKITMDGKEIVPTDASGAVVEPFAVDGTTYLPVRAVANALGLGVQWDGATQTVKLTGNAGYTLNAYDGYILAPSTIYSTSADQNGLENVFMYVDGTVESISKQGEYEYCFLITTDGKIAVANIPGATNGWSGLTVGKKVRACFQYLGYSDAVKIPVGGLVELGNLDGSIKHTPAKTPEPDQPTATNKNEPIVVYDDQYVAISFIGNSNIGKDSIYVQTGFYKYYSESLFYITNKTDYKLTFQPDALSFNGASYQFSGSEEIAPNSTGRVVFYTTEDEIPTTNLEKMSGTVSVIDFSYTLLEHSYEAKWTNINLQ